MVDFQVFRNPAYCGKAEMKMAHPIQVRRLLEQPLCPADRAFVSEQADIIRRLGRRTCSEIIEIGQRLLGVRFKLSRGRFLQWLDKELGWSERVSQRFMSAAEAFSRIIPDKADLPIDAKALYLLSDPTVPAMVRIEATKRASAGEHITCTDAELMIASAIQLEPTSKKSSVSDWYKVLSVVRIINKFDSVDSLFKVNCKEFDKELEKELPAAVSWINEFNDKFRLREE